MMDRGACCMEQGQHQAYAIWRMSQEATTSCMVRKYLVRSDTEGESTRI